MFCFGDFVLFDERFHARGATRTTHTPTVPTRKPGALGHRVQRDLAEGIEKNPTQPLFAVNLFRFDFASVTIEKFNSRVNHLATCWHTRHHFHAVRDSADYEAEAFDRAFGFAGQTNHKRITHGDGEVAGENSVLRDFE